MEERKIVWVISRHDGDEIRSELIGIYDHKHLNQAYEVFKDTIGSTKAELAKTDPDFEDCTTFSLPNLDDGQYHIGTWTYDDQCGRYVSVSIEPRILNTAQL